jgi:hypothetical protein
MSVLTTEYRNRLTGVKWSVVGRTSCRVLMRYEGMLLKDKSLSIGLRNLERYFEPVRSVTGWSDNPQQWGPTCARHFPVHHCDCSVCFTTINQRIALSKMKTYRCHKIVQAAKILEVDCTARGVQVTLEGGAQLTLSSERWNGTSAGDYYVKYDDGYASRSPAAAFEAGYAEIMPVEPGQYRKKPVVVEAWKIDTATSQPQWVRQAFIKERIDWSPAGDGMYVSTLEELMLAPEGHMLIQGVRGELYACDPEIFDETYESA